MENKDCLVRNMVVPEIWWCQRSFLQAGAAASPGRAASPGGSSLKLPLAKNLRPRLLLRFFSSGPTGSHHVFKRDHSWF